MDDIKTLGAVIRVIEDHNRLLLHLIALGNGKENYDWIVKPNGNWDKKFDLKDTTLENRVKQNEELIKDLQQLKSKLTPTDALKGWTKGMKAAMSGYKPPKYTDNK